MAGFLPLGVLVGLPGSLFVAWRYYLDAAPRLVACHFLAINAGFVLAAHVARRAMGESGSRRVLLLGCVLGAAGLGGLAWAGPPQSTGWRMGALAVLGAAGGVLSTALLRGLEPSFRRSPARTTARAGLWFGSGCLLGTLAIGLAYQEGATRVVTLGLGAVPLGFLLICALPDGVPPGARPGAAGQTERATETLRNNLRDLRSIATVLFSLLLFFQFGNEGTIAGWLPLFLIHRLGASPTLAIGVLAIYFCALALGRVLAQKLMGRVSRRKLLVGGVTAAMVGCTLLSFGQKMGEVAVGAAVVGVAFGPIYPLIAEFLDDRFSYHPGFYNGALSIGITGAMSTPWLLGMAAGSERIEYLMFGPAVGSAIVLVLMLLLMFEAHLMGTGAGRELKRAATAGKR